ADEQSIETRAATLSGRELGVVLRGAIGARYADGHVLYGSNGALLARKFDAARLTLADNAISLAPSAMQDWRSNRLMAQASSTGIVALRPPPTADVRFTWVDRHGQTLSTVGAVNSFTNFDVSPDGQRI